MRFAFDELAAKSVFGKVYLQSWIESIEIVDSRELVIPHRDVFTHSNLLALTTSPVRPAHYYVDRDPGKPTLEPPIGSGPYRVAEFDRNYVVYERVDDYWARDHPVNRGRYNFDTIRYDVYRDATTAREAFRKGLIDVFWETDIRYWFGSYDIPALTAGRILKDSRTVKRYIGAERALVFNLNRERLRDVRVREALTLAFDFEWQNRVLQHGSQGRASSHFAGSSMAASGLPTKRSTHCWHRIATNSPLAFSANRFSCPCRPDGAHIARRYNGRETCWPMPVGVWSAGGSRMRLPDCSGRQPWALTQRQPAFSQLYSTNP